MVNKDYYYITGWVKVAVRPGKQPPEETRRKTAVVIGPQQK